MNTSPSVNPTPEPQGQQGAFPLAAGSTLRPMDAGWIGHEWKVRGFYSDECIHCGTIAVEGHNGLAKNHEHCAVRASNQSNVPDEPQARSKPST